ncbi:ras-related protein Rab-8A-like [Limulus polyphemus]|uniref:Ras-related protein Rab-8A-like n=1 Tax=Limulus polyphemus TaxID=6850 RepID=A0ABM1BVZ0_LIMPO|nr:ras-related protein Rab-8A-like [Limulus polyphemus]
MYDVTNMDSFNHLSYWLRNVEENASPDVVKMLVGNKCDALHLRQVEKERGEKMADSFDIPFFECSCKQNINIDGAFLTLARGIREQRENKASRFEETEKLKLERAEGKETKPETTGRCGC